MQILGGIFFFVLYLALLPTVMAARRGPFIWIPVLFLNLLAAHHWILWLLLLMIVHMLPYNEAWRQEREKNRDRATYIFWFDN